ncbi:MAG: MFS transporter [Holosporaceae bacterium]|nr:MFS transporter [Holosporaceae bacterium]
MSKSISKNSVCPTLMWVAALLFFFYQFIARSSFTTVLNEQLMRHFQIDAAGIGVLASCYYWVYTLMQGGVGVVIDKFGPRITATIAALTFVLGIFLFIATSNCYVAGMGQMLIGFGSSFVFILVLKVITEWFPENEVPVKISYSVAIGSLGPVIGGPAVSYLVKHFYWIDVIKVFALFGLFLAAALWLVLRDKGSSACDAAGEKNISIMDSIKMILTSQQFWVLALFSMMQYAPLSALGDLWGVSFIKKAYGADSTVATLINNMLYLGMIVGSPTFAHLALFMNSYKKPMIIGIVFCAICVGLIVFCSQFPIWAAFVLFFFTGFSCGAVLAFPLAIAVFPSSIGATVTSFINMASMVSGVILMPLIGYIIDLSWDGTVENGIKAYSTNDFRIGLTSVFAFSAMGIILSFLIKDKSPKEKRE